MTKGLTRPAVLTMLQKIAKVPLLSASQTSFAYHATEEIPRPSQKKRRIASTSAWKATRRCCVGSPPKDAMPLAEPQVQPASSTAASAAPPPIPLKWKTQPPPKFITTPMACPLLQQQPTPKWKKAPQPPKPTSIWPPPPLVSELNADEDAEQPQLQVDSGEPEVTTPGDLDENEPEAATLSPPMTSPPTTHV